MGFSEEFFSKKVRNSKLFKAALTHRSVGGENNERLENLGDAVLDLIIAEYLFDTYPNLEEGALSRMRSYFVRNEMLASLAKKNKLGDEILLGHGELKSGGHNRDSILADCLEAVIGTCYLEIGLKGTKKFVMKLYKDELNNLPKADELKDPKTRLQELLQSVNTTLPEYKLIEEKSNEKKHLFVVQCIVKKFEIRKTGEGPTKRKAEQASAEKAFKQLVSTLS